MSSITTDCIEIQGITEPYLLHDLRLDIAPNDHGHAVLVLEIKEDGKAENLLQSLDNKMITIESKAKANTGVLFKGYVAGVTISPQLDKVMAEIRLVTATIQMDRKTESCSFQKKEAKYTEILSETAGKDGGVCTYTDDKMKTEIIGLPVIRYEESGWEFIRRLASRYWLPVIPDETADKPAFSVGMEPGGSAPEQGFFKKESASFTDMGLYIERKRKDETGSSSMEDYSGMKVRSYNNYKIGMSAAYGGKSLSICAKRAEMEQSELVFTYILGSKELYAPEPRYPEKLHGRSLTGTVVKCGNETVKIQLDIDRDSGNTKAEGDLYAFPWQPDTGNLMYCMPEKDTTVTLYIGGINEGEAIAVHSLRTGTEKDTDKQENRYLTTKDKKRMFLKPKELGYSLEDKEEGKTHFILKDGKGIMFRTEQKLVVQAKGKLKIAGKKVTAEGKKAVNIRQKSAGVEIKNKVNVKGKMTYLGFGATMGEMADRAETLTLKQKPGEETEGKSTLAMTSGKLGVDAEKGTVKNSNGKETVKDGEQFEKRGRKKVLKKNIKYKSNEGYEYETDDKGRIIGVSGSLKLKEGKRNSYAQSNVGKGDGREETDDGGHLIATIFNGSGNIDNLVPMDSNLNRGKWKVMENEWKQALSPPNPQKVKVKIKPIYGNDSQRPERFEVKYKIGNGRWKKEKFANKNQKEN